MQKNPSVTYTHYLIAVWDVLVWSLVLLPIITGGIWIDKPSLKLELAQVTVPVIFVSLLGVFLKFFRHYPLEKASSLRFLAFLWSKWEFFNQKKPVLTLVIGSLGVGALWCFASLFRHWSYHSGAQDLGIFTSAIWNLVSGHGYISSVKGGMNLFADHQSPTFWLFAPAFYFFPYPETLLVIQAFGLSFGALALRKISIQYLAKNHWGILLTPILYWAYLPLRNANAFDFHPEVLMLPLLLVCIACFQSQNIKSRIFGFFILILALGCKESAGPVCMGIGLAYFFNAGPQATLGFTKRLGPVLIILGLFVFYFDTQIVPGFFNNTYVYNIVYSHFGNDLMDLFFSPFLQ
ncbi:MAG: DUF2079 domain-containing protein, partial [Deltaproteobacteria bacterium]|nr:DUF2079 domain-containing protein [Deltaproteobacteria bacterium]